MFHVKCPHFFTCCLPTAKTDGSLNSEHSSCERNQEEEKFQHTTQLIPAEEKLDIHDVCEKLQDENATLRQELNEARMTNRLQEERLLAYSHLMISKQLTPFCCINGHEIHPFKPLAISENSSSRQNEPRFDCKIPLVQGACRTEHQLHKKEEKMEAMISSQVSDNGDDCEYLDDMIVVARGRAE